MPGPGFPVANKILYKYEQDRAYRLHRQKVRGGGGVVGRGYSFLSSVIHSPISICLLLCWKNLQLVEDCENVINAKKFVL